MEFLPLFGSLSKAGIIATATAQGWLALDELLFNFWDLSSVLLINLTAAVICRVHLHCRLFLCSDGDF